MQDEQHPASEPAPEPIGDQHAADSREVQQALEQEARVMLASVPPMACCRRVLLS